MAIPELRAGNAEKRELMFQVIRKYYIVLNARVQKLFGSFRLCQKRSEAVMSRHNYSTFSSSEHLHSIPHHHHHHEARHHHFLRPICCIGEASVYASASGLLRLPSSQQSDAAIATNDLSSNNKDGRELLSTWCDPATPVLWHP